MGLKYGKFKQKRTFFYVPHFPLVNLEYNGKKFTTGSYFNTGVSAQEAQLNR